MKDTIKHQQRFEPELDGLGRVESPVRKKDLPTPQPLESALARAMREALAPKTTK